MRAQSHKRPAGMLRAHAAVMPAAASGRPRLMCHGKHQSPPRQQAGCLLTPSTRRARRLAAPLGRRLERPAAPLQQLAGRAAGPAARGLEARVRRAGVAAGMARAARARAAWRGRHSTGNCGTRVWDSDRGLMPLAAHITPRASSRAESGLCISSGIAQIASPTSSSLEKRSAGNSTLAGLAAGMLHAVQSAVTWSIRVKRRRPRCTMLSCIRLVYAGTRVLSAAHTQSSHRRFTPPDRRVPSSHGQCELARCQNQQP